MTRRNGSKKPTTRSSVRCAIYTRKSTEEGLEQEFNSLDAQRDSGEAYIASQQHEGWECLPNQYDDGGFSGGDLDRPAMQRLMADIEAGKIDCVVVYKVDRLSRSLLDFARIMEVFEKHNVSFVSVTQQFNTATSMGRLILHVLLSFAQFERELISERTRDKIAASRRKGKWWGGMPVIGYDVVDRKLVVNQEEGRIVRDIFRLYLELESLIPVVQEIERRGYRNKIWTSSKGTVRGGRLFNKSTTHVLLTNMTYLGKVRFKDEVYEGEHDPIVSEEVFEQVQALLQKNRQNGGANVRNRFGALLKGILRCGYCDCGMVHTHTSKGNRRYRYYVCETAKQRGYTRCPTRSVPAVEIEQFVVNHIRTIANDPTIVAATLVEARQQAEGQIGELKQELAALTRQLQHDHAEMRKLVATSDEQISSRLVSLQERTSASERRAIEIREEITALGKELVSEAEVFAALTKFDPVWESLSIREQSRVIELLVDRVEYDGEKETVTVTFLPSGLRALARHAAFTEQDDAA